MVKNKFPNKNENGNDPVKQGWYNAGLPSHPHIRNVALILIITAIMAALTILTAHVIDKVLVMDHSQVKITAFSLGDQIKEVVVSDLIT
jgi:hypothetical protein